MPSHSSEGALAPDAGIDFHRFVGSGLERCVLALESEWGGSPAVSDDFQKLMVARTDHRVMIFEADSREHAEKVIQDLLEEVREYLGAQFGDRYLFAAWVRPIGFLFHTHVAGCAA